MRLWHEDHPLTRLRVDHPWLFALASGTAVFLAGIAIDAAANGKIDRTFVSAAIAIGWFAGIVAATRRRRNAPGT